MQIEKQLSFQDMLEAQTLNNELVEEIYKLRAEILKLDTVKIMANDESLSEFFLWKADVFNHINKIIFDYKKNEYR